MTKIKYDSFFNSFIKAFYNEALRRSHSSPLDVWFDLTVEFKTKQNSNIIITEEADKTAQKLLGNFGIGYKEIKPFLRQLHEAGLVIPFQPFYLERFKFKLSKKALSLIENAK
jgi:hypothetical protein